MLRLARVGRAVSPVTSYLSMEPRVRPSTEGIDRDSVDSLISLRSGSRWIET